MASMFKKASRQAAFIRAAICGTSGAGKSYSALLMARGLVGETGKIAVIDTERGSASLYSDLVDFDVAELAPPFSPARYRELIIAASREYDVLIIDSLSHAWAGEGGVLEMHDNATKAARGGNSYTAWRDVTPQHNALVDAILACQCHVITTMRSKTAYELQDNNGKKAPVKVGLAPVQRDGMEYEFTLCLDVSVTGHVATASKDRTRLWDGRCEVLTIAHGEELRRWLASGSQFELVDIETRLAEMTTGPAVTAYWRELMVKESHPQYRDILALFSAAKARIAEATLATATEVAKDMPPLAGSPARHAETLESAIDRDEDFFGEYENAEQEAA